MRINISMWVIFTLFVVGCLAALKASEIGVHDWHLLSIGEIKHATFQKGKVQFAAKRCIGQLEERTGKPVWRVALKSQEKVVSVDSKSVQIASKANQIITYVFPSDQDKNVDDRFLVNSTATTRLLCIINGAKEYILFNDRLQVSKINLAVAGSDEKFLSINELEPEKLVLVGIKDSQYFLQLFIKDEAQTRLDLKIKDAAQFLGAYASSSFFVLSLEELTVSFNSQLQHQKTFDKRMIDIIGSIVLFDDLSSRNMETLQDVSFHPIHSSKGQAHAVIGPKQVSIFQNGRKVGEVTNLHGTRLLRGWINCAVECLILAQYEDLTLVYYDLLNGVQKWIRHESLSSIEQKVFTSYEAEDNLNNAYHKELIGQTHKNTAFQRILKIPHYTILRLYEQAYDVIRLLRSLGSYLLHYLSDLKGGLSKFTLSEESQRMYGLRQFVIVATSQRTLFGLDSKNGAVLWKNNWQSQMVGLLKLRKDYRTQSTLFVLYEDGKSEITISEVSLSDGKFTQLDAFQCKFKPTLHKMSEHTLALRCGINVFKFSLEEPIQKELYFYSVEKNRIVGLKELAGETKQIWNINLSEDEKVVATAEAGIGHHSLLSVTNGEKVLFKNLDATGLAILTSRNQTHLELTVLSGQSGRIVFKQSRFGLNLQLGVSLLYDQNQVIVSYFNARLKLYEIWSVEQYQQHIETSALAMIYSYFEDKPYATESSRHRIIFLSQLYALPVTMKNIFIGHSKQSIIRRNLLVLTRDNKIYMIPRQLVSTRRPRKEVKTFFSNQLYPEYNYLLPFSSQAFLTYNLALQGLHTMAVSPTQLESTIFVWAHGFDCFMMQIAPDRKFDMIGEDFRQFTLLAIMVSVTVLVVFLKRRFTFAKLKKAHLQ